MIDPVARLGNVGIPGSGVLVLVLDAHDIRWASGFTGSAGRVLIDPETERAWCIVDDRYTERAEVESAEHVREHGGTIEVVRVRPGESMDEATARVAGTRPIVVDPRSVTVAAFESLRTLMSIGTAESNIADLRRVKTAAEVDLMARAASIADGALASVLDGGLCGLTEIEVRDRLEAEMRRLGADGVSFPTIVAAGENGARPHHSPTAKVISPGEGVIIDMGAEVRGYRSDMTRTVFVGEPSREMEEMFASVRRAQEAAVVNVRAGTVGSDVDAAARSSFAREGVAHEYLHSTGHGVGLAIHEQPILGPSCTAELRRGEVVTAEPGLYRRGVGGVRIEDLLVVSDGPARPLTLSPKDLTCPPSPRTT